MTLSGFASEGVHLEVAGAADIRGTSRVPSQPRPLVSVIVPTYAARAPLLKSALASIWAQEGLGEQFEVEPIVVDNASSGPTDEVVRSFPGTRYVRFETNRGAGAARNAGLREATGTYVAFLDDDDLWMPHRLSVQVPVLEQAQEMEVGYSQFINVHRNGTWRMIPDPEGPSGWILDALGRKEECRESFRLARTRRGHVRTARAPIPIQIHPRARGRGRTFLGGVDREERRRRGSGVARQERQDPRSRSWNAE